MKVVEMTGVGTPDVLTVGARPRPEPTEGQLLIRVAACGVCGHDVLARRGKLAAGPGSVLGHEIAGVVVAVGTKVGHAWLGRRVALVQRIPCGDCSDCRAGATSQCRCGPGFYGEDLSGGYAEYVIASPLNAVELPDEIDTVQAAILSCGIGTGLRALRTAELSQGDVVVITGAGGGVGVHAVQLAAHFGYRVIATTSDSKKVQRLKQWGAAWVLVNPGRKELRTAAGQLGRPRGADAVLENTGAPTFATSMRALGPRGRLVLVGNVQPEWLEVDPGPVIVRELQLKGSAHATQEDLAEVVSLVGLGAIHPVTAGKWPLAQAASAHQEFESGGLVGRTVVVP